MYASKYKEMPGGKKLVYSAHVMLQTNKKMIKSVDTDYISGLDESQNDRGYVKGNLFKFFCAKNRISKPGFECEVYIDFDVGIQKWDGLVNDAIKYGFIQSVRGGYIVPSYSEKKITHKDLVTKDEIWNTFIEDFNKMSLEKLSYSNSTSRELDEIESGLNETEPETKTESKA